MKIPWWLDNALGLIGSVGLIILGYLNPMRYAVFEIPAVMLLVLIIFGSVIEILSED
jgi:hypothetical protein